ncbi:MAG TPA: vanadium-dependent haloperoxidase, partial [Woeseiaceae bacterium]|nr:vanadium-dependent haloperoxidase [Woeseiaceae bacterium]
NHLGVPPLPPPAPFAFPWLGDMHPFVVTGPARFRALPPPELTSARYTADYNEVKGKGALTGSSRTPEQTDIANFWLDNFGVQLNRALRGLAAKHVPRIGDRARLYALANLAGADALITSWDSKKLYNVWRPVTAVQEGETDGNPNTAGDPAWLPFTNTPPYPDYTSGANNVTAALMHSAALFFGTDNMSIEITSANPAAIKKTRTFSSFSAVMRQMVNVRIYHGIHFRFADTAARRQGEQVAEYVYDHALLPIQK